MNFEIKGSSVDPTLFGRDINFEAVKRFFRSLLRHIIPLFNWDRPLDTTKRRRRIYPVTYDRAMRGESSPLLRGGEIYNLQSIKYINSAIRPHHHSSNQGSDSLHPAAASAPPMLNELKYCRPLFFFPLLVVRESKVWNLSSLPHPPPWDERGEARGIGKQEIGIRRLL